MCGIAGYSGDGWRAVAAELWKPIDVEVDANGNVYIAEWTNDKKSANGR